jgi:predicted RNase H-like HicB family nuclease
MDVQEFHVIISEDPDEGGFTVQCVEIPGAISQGETLEEAKANIVDAIQTILDHRRKEAAKTALLPSHHLETVAVELDA